MAAYGAGVTVGMLVAHLVVNLAWSAVFRGARSIVGGLVGIVVRWLTVGATIPVFARVDRRVLVSIRQTSMDVLVDVRL